LFIVLTVGSAVLWTAGLELQYIALLWVLVLGFGVSLSWFLTELAAENSKKANNTQEGPPNKQNKQINKDL